MDASVGRRRILKVRRKRLTLGLLRARNIKKLARTTTKARSLYRTGAQSQMLWGMQGHGTSPSEVFFLRRQTASAFGVSKSGACLTTGLHTLKAGPAEVDPAKTPRENLFQTWFRFINNELGLLGGIQRAWPLLRDKLRSQYRWLRVKSHLSAVIATLYDIGWEPTAALQWPDPSGQVFCVKPLSWDQQQRFLYHMQLLLSMRPWSLNCPKSHNSAGLEEGGYITA
eukprot:4221508-Pyramimonas_sp.AAC.1